MSKPKFQSESKSSDLIECEIQRLASNNFNEKQLQRGSAYSGCGSILGLGSRSGQEDRPTGAGPPATAVISIQDLDHFFVDQKAGLHAEHEIHVREKVVGHFVVLIEFYCA